MKFSTQYAKKAFMLSAILLFSAPLTVPAQDDGFYVISVMRKLKNVVTVAKANGDFTDPVAAVNSITDASPSNPYLVVIGPGVYTLTRTLVMKEHVDLVGSGENVTKLTGAISSDYSDSRSAVISGADNSALSSFTVENTGGSTHSIALYLNASPMVSNVTATASGAVSNHGIYSFCSSPTMTDVTSMASGGTSCMGIHNVQSSPQMRDVTATATGGMHNHGVYNYASSPTMTGVIAKASGGTDNDGIASFVYTSAVVRRSTMEGAGFGLYVDSGSSAVVSQSTIIGGVGGSGAKECVASDNGGGTALNPDCTTP